VVPIVLLNLFAQNLKADLDAIVMSPKLRGATAGILVTETDGTVLYEHEADRRLNPASNEKLFTCAYALHVLGPDFRPNTRFWAERDALVVRSEGDPTLPYDALQSIAKKLNPRRKPVKVSEAFRAGYPATWELDDLPNRYAAPVYAFTVDRASLELWCVNGKVELRPARFDIGIERVSHTGPFHDEFDVFHHRLKLYGELPKTDKRLDTLGLPDADFQAASVLGRSVRFVTEAPSRPPDFVYTGDPIKETLATCLQMSDNNLAESFLLMAASRKGDLDDPYGQAIPQLKAFLHDQVGLDPGEADMADGCGMSRHDWVTPWAINRLLRWSLRQTTGPMWRTSLDHPGSGTLTYRLKGIPFQGKTGTIDCVSAISGYLDVDGRTVVVSIILNNFACTSHDAKELENMLVEKITVNLSGGTRRALK